MKAEKKAVTTLEEKKEEEKRQWIKTSFWAPDNTPMENLKEVNALKEPKEPSKAMYCPAVAQDSKDEAHRVKLKELISLKLDENDLLEYVCWTCQKPLVHQKISVLRTCGHVMCKECILQFAFHKISKQSSDKGRCMKCD